MKYWLYTDREAILNSKIPDDAWAICEFVHPIYKGKDEIDTAIVTKVIAIGTNEYVDIGFEMEIYNNSITEDPKRVLKFLFTREF